MKTILLACFTLCAHSLSLAGEPVDWAAKAELILGHWKSTKLVPRKPLPEGMSVEGEEWDLVMRRDGTATLRISRQGTELEKQEQNYCIGETMIAFYQREHAETGSADLFGWRIVGNRLELDLLGAASVTIHLEKVHQDGADQSATPSDPEPESGEKPQPKSGSAPGSGSMPPVSPSDVP